MTLPKALPLDHPRVEQFRQELEDVLQRAFDEGVHLGVLVANAHRAAALMLIGFGASREQYQEMVENAWKYALEDLQTNTALIAVVEGKGAKA